MIAAASRGSSATVGGASGAPAAAGPGSGQASHRVVGHRNLSLGAFRGLLVTDEPEPAVAHSSAPVRLIFARPPGRRSAGRPRSRRRCPRRSRPWPTPHARSRRSVRQQPGRRGRARGPGRPHRLVQVQHVRHSRCIDRDQRGQAHQKERLVIETRRVDRVRGHGRQQVEDRRLARRIRHGHLFLSVGRSGGGDPAARVPGSQGALRGPCSSNDRLGSTTPVGSCQHARRVRRIPQIA